MLKKIQNKIKTFQYAGKRDAFFKKIGVQPKDAKKYAQELKQAGLIEYIRQQRADFNANSEDKKIRNHDFSFGGLGENESIQLYCLLRTIRPQIIVETGVCNGVSSTIILKALKENGSGRLISVDFPEIEGLIYNEGTFWAGKGGSVVPKDKAPGWIIPDELRKGWELHLGKSQDLLPDIMANEKNVDIFIHDSEHSYECMTFEYQCAFPHIKKGGLLISDDIFANSAFDDFAEKINYTKHYLSPEVGILIK